MASLRDSFRAAVGGLPRVFWTLWAGMLVNRLASFVLVFLALYLVHDRGFTPAEAGRVVALFGAGVVCAGPVGGLLADTIGRRPTMLLGLVLGGLSVAAIGLTREPAVLAPLAFLAGGTGEIYRPAMNAAVADVVPPADRVRAFGLVYWAVNLGWAVGLGLAGLVAERGYVPLFLADAATSVAFAALVWARVPETRPIGLVHEPAVSGLLRVLRDRPFAAFLGLHLAGLLVFTQFQLAAPLDFAAHGVGASAFALLMAVNGVGVVVLQPALTPWLRRHDGARLLATSAVLFGLGFGANALGGSLPLYVTGVALWTLGEVVGFPVASALVANLAPAALRGRYQGAFSMAWGVAFMLSPLVGGEVLARLGAPTLWVGCLVVGVLVAAGHLLAGPARRRRLEAMRNDEERGAAASA